MIVPKVSQLILAEYSAMLENVNVTSCKESGAKGPFLGFRLGTPGGDLYGARFVDHYSVVHASGGA